MSSISQVTTPTAFIYGLCDPVSGRVRYVGKATDPRKRLVLHLCDSQLKPNTHRNNWIKSLKSQGLIPSLVILESIFADGDWRIAERAWITHFKNISHDLTNGTAGGDGLSNPSEETRYKCGSSMRGKKANWTPEHKAKISAANKARALDENWRKKMSLAMRGNKNGVGMVVSQAHRDRLSALRKAEFAARKSI